MLLQHVTISIFNIMYCEIFACIFLNSSKTYQIQFDNVCEKECKV